MALISKFNIPAMPEPFEKYFSLQLCSWTDHEMTALTSFLL